MELGVLCVILAAIVVWGLISARAAVISTPIFFVLVGLLVAVGLDVTRSPIDPHQVKLVAEVTLVWVLFADASRIRPGQLRADAGRYARLLGIGLALTIALGAFAGATILNLSFWSALLLGAALAPTDAALGSAVMADSRVPLRVRHTLNVESGLNDGIATPVVMLALAGVAAEMGAAEHAGPERAPVGLILGAVVGAAVGVLGGLLLRAARRRGWSSDEFAGPAVLALAVLAYAGALLAGGNGFVAAFVGGIAFGASAGASANSEIYYVEQTCGLSSMVAWLLFGALAVPTLATSLSWASVLYAVLSLTVIRMLPVAISLLGTRTGWRTVLFLGWFGPRGLASVVFALIVLEELADGQGQVNVMVATIGFTVLLSVLAHGLSARPLAGRYGDADGAPTPDSTAEPTLRRLVSKR